MRVGNTDLGIVMTMGFNVGNDGSSLGVRGLREGVFERWRFVGLVYKRVDGGLGCFCVDYNVGNEWVGDIDEEWKREEK